ncbi:YbgA family protein [Maridesulfovibrio bastinii]|uniref:YbgA family protein n=1 Tax=Maridesulfovibrio bastinii TaxID=47157 RepID=UPI000419EEAA|nr:DUF523 and DUF1722 domain-containing protein [Maridesulfovibrio bastinii]
MSKFKIGVSSCLLGNKVRYDGGHQLDRWITDELGAYVEFVPVCPEVECGLGIPREALRLVGSIENYRLMTQKTGIDITDKMSFWSESKLEELQKENLCGFIFKRKSPSSGMERVKIYNPQGMPVNKGVGIFAKMFMEKFPTLPVEEDGRLHDPILRENFIESIFTMQRWRETVEPEFSIKKLMKFHTNHKLLIFSHHESTYRQMGKLVANHDKQDDSDVCGQYFLLLSKALKYKPTIKKHINVLQHIMGYFKKDLSQDEKSELLEVFENYRKELVPLIVPVTLLNHYVRKYDKDYLKKQYYLNPHPIELKLRNHS